MNAPLRRRRLQLVLIFAVFLVPIVLAFVLRQSGWQPQRLRNVGELVQPPRDLGTVILQEEGGAAFAWRDADYRWTLLLLGGPDCAAQCATRLIEAEGIRALLTSKATRVRIAYLGPPPPDAVRARLREVRYLTGAPDALAAERPGAADSVAALLVDPAGLLVVRHAAGYDPEGVRKDLSRLIR
ncbi:MAG TPA: hypothetical protein PLN91_05495 [Rhodanobacteraceae bacterium]|nr:hypothetical protein [Rhodanobacteraceae bacterium]